MAYLKWDMNRALAQVWSASLPGERQGEVYHRYVLGVYDLLERIRQANPQTLIEGCSGGGGRFDMGMLYYTPQIWCSDNTDAIDRLFIQYGTSFAYPPSTMGAHVSAVPNEQTGRSVPLETRGIVAMSGTFGYEMDLGILSEAEKATVARQIRDYREGYDLIQQGDYYRLTAPSPDGPPTAWLHVSPDRRRALLCLVAGQAHAGAPFHLHPAEGAGSGAAVPAGRGRRAVARRCADAGRVFAAGAGRVSEPPHLAESGVRERPASVQRPARCGSGLFRRGFPVQGAPFLGRGAVALFEGTGKMELVGVAAPGGNFADGQAAAAHQLRWLWPAAPRSEIPGADSPRSL